MGVPFLNRNRGLGGGRDCNFFLEPLFFYITILSTPNSRRTGHWARTQTKSRLKVMANEDTMLRTQMLPRLPARATFVADTKFVSETQKCF